MDRTQATITVRCLGGNFFAFIDLIPYHSFIVNPPQYIKRAVAAGSVKFHVDANAEATVPDDLDLDNWQEIINPKG